MRSLRRPRRIGTTAPVVVQRHSPIWSKRSSSCSWLRMYSRIAASSRRTVDTQYLRSQKSRPTKFLFRSPYTRARWIALFPLMNPITCDTRYLGGIERGAKADRLKAVVLDPTR